MSDLAQRLASLSPAQRKLLERRLAQQPPAAESIAIVGMACRFPGAPNLDAYWRLIRDGVNAACEVPADRWNPDEFYDPTGETPGKMSVRWAALVDKPDEFDPQFFGITPREASRMDPQQRLLLEVAWEAMENAGRPADQMAGSRTGVFVGIGGADYAKVAVPYDDYYAHIDAHVGTGNALSIAANRLSYIFDFHGPSAAVDTACSSSSLAIHFAVESLRRRESDAALAGGVNMILTPETTIAFSKARMLSPDGVCRPFDAGANGYVRGEGCGLVFLKRLADAERDGDRVFAVLRATSVNQDGRTSGISAPNGQSQMACIRAALRQAGLAPDDIGYIEAHGTGTPLGDPIEMQALGEIFRTAGAEAPLCYVSSVKANVGHMETVSGVAGLIKVALMMERESIAPQAHFQSLNPHIKLDGTRLAVPTEPVAWPRGAGRRIAGVSSFGFGGTNTHLVVEAWDEHSPRDGQSCPSEKMAETDRIVRPTNVLKLSAKTPTALAREAEELAAWMSDHPDAAVADVCYSANIGRAEFHHRAAITAQNADELKDCLTALAAGLQPAGVKQSTVRAITRPKIAFLFTGQGAQYIGMGRGLYESYPVFRAAIDECDEILGDIWDEHSLRSILYPENGAVDSPDALLHHTEYTQPALFALEYALAELWQSWGVTPDIVLGHSVGEYAAACVAGVMSLEDGLALIAQRARMMQSVRRHGKMAVVFAPPGRVEPVIGKFGGRVVIAVLNGPENTVISGDAEAVDAAAAEFAAVGVQVKPLNVSHAFHSPLMDEMLDEFEEFAATIEYQPPQALWAANLTGQLMTVPPTARYWRDHLRNTVRFADCMARVADAAPTAIIEIGPTASLLGMGRRCVPESDAAWLPSLRQGQDDWQVIATSVAECYVRGGQIDWRGWDRPWPRRHLLLPNYPFERSRHWFALDPARRRTFGDGERASAHGESSGHVLLGSRLSTVWANALFEASLGARSPGYLIDHQVQGSPVTPAAAYVEQALAAADQVFGPGQHGVANLVIQQAMFLPEGQRRRVQVSVAPESGGEATFEAYSRPGGSEDSSAAWAMHATGSLVHESRASQQPPRDRIDLEAARARATSLTSRPDFYRMMAERGLAYGPSFQVLGDLRRSEQDALIEVRLPDAIVREAGRYRLHPALGDALMQSMSGAVPLERDGSFSPYTYMPVAIRRVRLLRPIEDYAQPLFTHVVRTSSDANPGPDRVAGDVLLVDANGDVLVAFEGVEVQRLGRGAAGGESDTSQWLYRVAWQPSELPTTGEPTKAALATGAWLIFADEEGVGRALGDHLGERGQQSVLIEPGTGYEFHPTIAGNGHPGRRASAIFDPLEEEHYRRLIADAFGEGGRRCLGIVHLWSLDVPEPGTNGDAWSETRRLGCGSVLQLVRALTRTSLPAPTPSLWLVTCGAQAVEADENGAAPAAFAQAPLLGLARVAALELPELHVRTVDLDPESVDRASVLSPVGTAAAALADELAAGAADGEVAYRDGRRFVARLTHTPEIVAEAEASGGSLAVPAGRPFQLRITKSGSLDALQFVVVDRRPPEAGQVEIKVRATGLNFSDVLKALGLYPGIKDAIVPLGIEASGVVMAVGDGVTQFTVGDEVCGVVPYAFASHARTADYALVPKPAGITHEEACTIPITFLTAYYGLVRLAHLQPGERVLIHAGAGGVGLAAIQIAQQIGAEIFATAGSDEKREFLRSLGVEHVYSSRSTAFADEILADTDRQGVDVVLNSLPGEAITKSLSILRAYGRFLEIGKTDIYQNRMIGLLPFQDNLSYFAIDLDRMLRDRPDYIRGLFAEVMEQFVAGHYRPLAFTRFDAEQTIDAFRYMSQRKNIGKVVVALESRESEVSGSRPSTLDPRPIRHDGTYLITGGLGALGLQVAEWLAAEGAGTIALLARRAPTHEVERRLAAIRAKDANVMALQGDVADAASLAEAIRQMPADAPPLRGVVHAAGVLADGLLADMSLEQLDRAMLPKVLGAWNLHAVTREAPLDFFVLFSSVASVLGSPGQANYAAGNAGLDALAHARRDAGLPATAINWGPWAGAGMAAEAIKDQSSQARGMNRLATDQSLKLLGKLLRTDVAQVAVMDAQWGELLRQLGTRRPALLADIAADGEQPAMGTGVDHAFRQQLLAADAETRQTLVRDYIRTELARIMGVAPETLEADRPLATFGLDSLLALELKNNLEGRLDFTLPMAKLMEGPSIASLADATVELVTGDVATATGDAAPALAPLQISAPGDGWTPLVALRAAGARPPLVLLPALGGDIRGYDELTHALGDDQPVYAVRPRGIDHDLPPHRTMDEMVADYADALRRKMPGPYRLAGWSTGGVYAFALAEALERAGEEVALVALFDTPLPTICDDVDLDDDARFLCDLVNFANCCVSGTSARIDYDRLHALPAEERFQAGLAEARRLGTVPAGTPEAYIRRLVHVGEANVRAIQGYRPRPVSADVHLFLPTERGGLAEIARRELAEDGDHGWSTEVGQQAELHEVPGSHFSMITGDGAAQIAQTLQTLIDRPHAAREPQPGREHAPLGR